MEKIAINGSFVLRKVTGVERFSIEIIKELDKICDTDTYELVIPSYIDLDFELKNIKTVYYGKLKGKMWTQIDFCLYTIKKHMIPLSLDSIAPVFKPGLVCIHDITFKVNKDIFKGSFRYRISLFWRNFQYFLCFKRSSLIFTVSEFSKSEMLKYYTYPSNHIIVLGNGWNHISSVIEDDSITSKYIELCKSPFFFSLCSIGENKNLKWIIETAKYHPQYTFIIGGGAINKYGESMKKECYSNVKFVGYLSDGEIKYLMKKCKAFIYPSIYEGFGIPPLEALSVGAKIIISSFASS